MKQKAAIIDLDGTLSNANHRVHFISRRPKNWDAFFAAQIHDPVNSWCLELIKELYNQGVKIIFLTARPETQEASTIQWLHQNTPFQVVLGDNLLMRPEGDRREDVIVKKLIYDTHIKGQYEILMAVDDKESIVEMWKREGIDARLCSNNGLK